MTPWEIVIDQAQRCHYDGPSVPKASQHYVRDKLREHMTSVLEILEGGVPASLKELAEVLGLSKDRTGRILRAMLEEGTVKIVRKSAPESRSPFIFYTTASKE
jgi:transcription initiation factor IIE alpha subunit